MERLLLHPEIVLRVLELSDVTDIAVLSEIPEFNEYIEKYKTSIIKAKQSVFLLPAGWAGTDAIITHHPRDLNPPYYIFNTELRFVDEWGAIDIMRERDAEINTLLYTSSFLRLSPGIDPKAGITWPKLDDEAVPKLRCILRRALYICNAISDIEAQSVVAMDVPVPRYNFLPRGPFPLTMQADVHWKHYTDPRLADNLQYALYRWRIPELTRERQYKFVQTLCDADLLALWTLCYLASESLHEWRSTAFRGDMDAAIHTERAFKHCILSYGSYFLYGHVRGSGPRSKHKMALLGPVVRDFESDDPADPSHLPPGALAAMNSTLMKRWNVGMQVGEKALDALIAVLGVDKKAFDNPPSTTVWGA